jgi:enoyl-CoA hydratase
MGDMSYDHYSDFRVAISDGIATLAFGRPDILNALSPETMRQMQRLWVQLDDDPAVKVIILTGVGDKFSVGADYGAMKSGPWRDPFDGDTFAEAMRRVDDQLKVRVPIIAAVNGDVIGGGATIALLCDLVIMDETARIGDPHVRAGAVAGDGGCAIWTMLCGPLRAKEYLMTGDLLTAREAERIGLVNRVVAQGTAYEEAMRVARRFADDLPPVAVKWTKYAINKTIRDSLASSFDVSLALELLSFMTEDRAEAVASFLEKRKGNFVGR